MSHNILLFKCSLYLTLNDCSFYCSIAFLCKKSEATVLIFCMWLNTTFYSVKRLYTNDGGEYMMLELQYFLKEKKIIYETSTSHVH